MGLWQRGGALSGVQALARDAGLGEALGFCFVLGSERMLTHLCEGLMLTSGYRCLAGGRR